MRNYLNVCAFALLSYPLLSTLEANSRILDPVYQHQVIQNSDEVFLKQSAVLCLEQLRASNLAAKQGSARTKKIASQLILGLTKVSEELRALAKNKAIDLPTTLPDGGMRPDGRIDSAPDNLQDTARLRNNGGQAGNTGSSASVAAGLSNTVTNRLIENLSALKGQAFDQAYINLLKNDRGKALQLLDQGSKSNDSGISDFAKKYMKTLQNTSIK